MSNLIQRVTARFLGENRKAKAIIPLEMITDVRYQYDREDTEVLRYYLDLINSGRKDKGWLGDILKDWKAFATRNRRYYEGTDLEEYYLDYKRRRVDFKKVYIALKELHDLL